jgi:hypothetical protein
MEVESNNRSSLGAGGTTEAAGQAGGVSQESFIELRVGKMVSLSVLLKSCQQPSTTYLET